MEIYLLKSAGSLLVLYLFYKLFLEKENMHTVKRFYLLASLIAAFTFPLITFTVYVEKPVSETIALPFTIFEMHEIAEHQEQTPFLPVLLWSIYAAGVVFFSIRFFRNLFQMLLRIKRSAKHISGKITYILLESKVIPHTFFNCVFVNKSDFEVGIIPTEVLLHEETHAEQKHSLDILFVELVKIVFWFNPIVWLMKHEIRQNHEFLADLEVLKTTKDITHYQNLLLAFSSNAAYVNLANAINYSSIKKRLTVMKTQTSKRVVWAKSLMLIPLSALLIYGCSETEEIETTPNQVGNTEEVEKSLPPLPPPPPPPPPPQPPYPPELPSYKNLLEEIAGENAKFYYRDKEISPEKAKEIIEANHQAGKTFSIQTNFCTNSPNNIKEITIFD